jgi:prepilin-type N-terminal cleavage/methylation domain-containing protein
MFNKIIIKNKKGFTLIELIVSVTIIAVLTIVGMVSFSGTNKGARDSRRMADLENIRMSLELYRQGTGDSYPVSSDINDLSILSPNYLKEIPIDPKDDTDYYYYSSDGLTYEIYAIVEDAGSSNISGYIYQVTNP